MGDPDRAGSGGEPTGIFVEQTYIPVVELLPDGRRATVHP